MTPSSTNPFGSPPRRPQQQPVRMIGAGDPAGMQPASALDRLMGASQIDEMGRLMANPQMLEGAPPYVIELMNKVRALHIEVAASNLAQIRRGLLTLEEVSEARMIINQQVDEVFRSIMGAAERAMNQAPTQPPPARPDQQP